MNGLSGKCVLVTGGGTGIGAGIVEAFAESGARLGIHHWQSTHGAQALAEKIRARGGEVALLRADLLDPVGRDRLVSEFVERFARIDVLVNNAGGPVGTKHFLELDPESWEKAFALNVATPFFLAQSAFQHMKEAGEGRIINISSIGVKYAGSPNTVHYSAAKAALEAITRSLAKVGAKFGILVNAVRPGVVETNLHQDVPRESFLCRVNLIPLKRPGTPRDIAGMVRYLASDAGAFITGQIISVSGGD